MIYNLTFNVKSWKEDEKRVGLAKVDYARYSLDKSE